MEICCANTRIVLFSRGINKRIAYYKGSDSMELKDELRKIRKEVGMNRKEFAEYFGIPYRTVQDWELGNRKMPEYLFRLMEYKIQVEQLRKK